MEDEGIIRIEEVCTRDCEVFGQKVERGIEGLRYDTIALYEL
jgi:hypothetical protein